LPAHSVEATCSSELIDETRLDEAFQISVSQIRPPDTTIAAGGLNGRIKLTRFREKPNDLLIRLLDLNKLPESQMEHARKLTRQHRSW